MFFSEQLRMYMQQFLEFQQKKLCYTACSVQPAALCVLSAVRVNANMLRDLFQTSQEHDISDYVWDLEWRDSREMALPRASLF